MYERFRGVLRNCTRDLVLRFKNSCQHSTVRLTVRCDGHFDVVVVVVVVVVTHCAINYNVFYATVRVIQNKCTSDLKCFIQ